MSVDEEDQTATATADPPDTPPATEVDDPAVPEDSDQEFRNQQKAQAEAQGQTADNAVPEQRPIASQRVEESVSPLTQRLMDEGAIPTGQEEPMPKSAYDAANDPDIQAEAAAAAVPPQAHVGAVVKIKDGPHRGRKGAVLRILTFVSPEDQLVQLAGGQNASSISRPAEVELSFRGDDRDGERIVLDLSEVDYELIPNGFAGRSAITGSL